MVCAAFMMAATACSTVTRKLLYHPTHSTDTRDLQEWRDGGTLIGYCRVVANPDVVWLFVPGNGGQAADRAYALPAFSPRDSVYIVEYPGYGLRPGVPSRNTLDAAVAGAWRCLRQSWPHKRVCVVAESIGSGPASQLCRQSPPPDKLIFVVPFATLQAAAAEHVRSSSVKMLLSGGRNWDNVAALRGYQGPVQIFGARDDTVIPLRHARALADSLPQARLTIIPGGHNDWASQKEVRFNGRD